MLMRVRVAFWALRAAIGASRVPHRWEIIITTARRRTGIVVRLPWLRRAWLPAGGDRAADGMGAAAIGRVAEAGNDAHTSRGRRQRPAAPSEARVGRRRLCGRHGERRRRRSLSGRYRTL